jgi:hypothetical protein
MIVPIVSAIVDPTKRKPAHNDRERSAMLTDGWPTV